MNLKTLGLLCFPFSPYTFFLYINSTFVCFSCLFIILLHHAMCQVRRQFERTRLRKVFYAFDFFQHQQLFLYARFLYAFSLSSSLRKKREGKKSSIEKFQKTPTKKTIYFFLWNGQAKNMSRHFIKKYFSTRVHIPWTDKIVKSRVSVCVSLWKKAHFSPCA